MIERRMPDGTIQSCQIRDLNKGDVFRCVNDGETGSWLDAIAEPMSGPAPEDPTGVTWFVASQLERSAFTDPGGDF